MNKRQIIRKVLVELKTKKLLKESPEGESNAVTTDLQDCVEVLSNLPEKLQTILDSTVSSEDIDILERTINSISYVNKKLNDLITKHTAGLTEDMSKDGEVNMTVDNVIAQPQTLKKLTDKDIQVDVIDANGKNLAEAFDKATREKIKSTWDRPKLKSIQQKIRQILSNSLGRDLTGELIFTDLNKTELRYKFYTHARVNINALAAALTKEVPGVTVKLPNKTSMNGHGFNFYIPYSLFQLPFATSSNPDNLGNTFAESKKRKSLSNLNESVASDKLEQLFDQLVPSSGASETIEGEIVRAINRVWYRYNNDGDVFFRGYGLETAAPSVKYLLKSPIGSMLKPIFSKMVSGVRAMPKRKYGDFEGQFSEKDPYLKGLEQIGQIVVKYVESKGGKYTPNTSDSR
ncbi:MAG: hypothetical protein ABIP51_01245 [Bacteroidia bacterium]